MAAPVPRRRRRPVSTTVRTTRTHGAPLPDSEVDGETRGIGGYVGTVRSDDAVESAILPVGDGMAVSTKAA